MTSYSQNFSNALSNVTPVGLVMGMVLVVVLMLLFKGLNALGEGLVGARQTIGDGDGQMTVRYIQENTHTGAEGNSLNSSSRGPAPDGYGTIKTLSSDFHGIKDMMIGSRVGPEIGAVDKLLRQSQMASAGKEGAENKDGAISDEELARAAL